MQTHSMVIFYRVPAFPDVLRCIEEAKALGLPHYFELDDLIFDIDDYAANPNLGGLDAATAKGLFDGAILYRQALELCRNIIASTPYLAERMQAAGGGSATVIENALDAETIRAAAKVRRRSPDGKVRILYGSGTRTHDADFALIAPALERVAAEHENVEIMLVGELNPPKVPAWCLASVCNNCQPALMWNISHCWLQAISLSLLYHPSGSTKPKAT